MSAQDSRAEHDNGETLPDVRSLLVRSRRGDPDAFAELVEVLRPALERLDVLRRSRSADRSIADLVQDVCVRVWQSLDQFRGDDDPRRTDADLLAIFRAWAMRIAERLASNARRDRNAARRRPADGAVLPLGFDAADGREPRERDPAASATTPSGAADRSERAARVREALARLDDDEMRRIVALRFFEGAPLATIARRLDLTYDVARARYESAMQALERALRDLD